MFLRHLIKKNKKIIVLKSIKTNEFNFLKFKNCSSYDTCVLMTIFNKIFFFFKN